MEQVREREEPDTNSDSVEEDTITSGLGTGREITKTSEWLSDRGGGR